MMRFTGLKLAFTRKLIIFENCFSMNPKLVVFVRVYGIFLLLVLILLIRLGIGLDSFRIFMRILLIICAAAIGFLTD